MCPLNRSLSTTNENPTLLYNTLYDIIHNVNEGFIQINLSNSPYKSLAFVMSNFKDLRELKNL